MSTIDNADNSSDLVAKNNDNSPHGRSVDSDEAFAAEKRPAFDPNVFPDGGWEAWLVVAGGFSTVLASFGWINCKPVYCYYDIANLDNKVLASFRITTNLISSNLTLPVQSLGLHQQNRS